jgi:outer membrane protein TolC
VLALRVGHRVTPILMLLVLAFAAPGTASAGEPRELTPSGAVALAVENDSGLRQARLGLSLAVLALRAAEYSTYLPTVGLAIELPQLTAAGLGSDIGGSLFASLPLPWGDGAVTGSLGVRYNTETSALAAPTWQVSLADVFDFARPDGTAQALEVRRRAVGSAERSYQAAANALVVSTLRAYGNLLAEARQTDRDRQAVDRLTADLKKVQDLAAQGYKGDQDVNEARLLLLEAQVRAEESADTYASDLEAFCRETLGIDESCRLSSLDLTTTDLLAAARGLLEAEIPAGAISGTSAVIAAEQSAADAQDALREARADFLPSLSIEAKIDSEEWSLGVGVSLDLLAPDRKTNVDIAETNLELAKEKLDSARRAARNEILNLKSSLLSAVRSAESLTLETEKWRLEEQVLTAKRDAGSLSDSDWVEFLEDKDAFEIDAAGRSTSLLVAYLTYRSALGMELNWEEWL